MINIFKFKKESNNNDGAFQPLHENFRNKILRLNLIYIIIIFLTEIFFILYLSFSKNSYDNYTTIDLIKELVFEPSLLNFSSYFLIRIVLKSKFLDKYISENFKNLLPIFHLLLISHFTIIAHYRYPAIYSLMLIPTIICAAYGDLYHFKLVSLINTALFFTSIYYIHLKTDYNWFIFSNFLVILSAFIGTYFIAKEFVYFEQTKNNVLSKEIYEKNKLSLEAKKDSLTNLYNHNFLETKTNEFLENSSEVFAIMFDIDHFKNVNDTYGHAFGDIVLKRLSAIIKKFSSENIICARYGGEEFSILVKDSDLITVLSIAEKIRLDFSKQEYREFINTKFTLSAGVYKKNNEITFEELFKKADEALYYSKNNGRNQITIKQNDEFISMQKHH